MEEILAEQSPEITGPIVVLKRVCTWVWVLLLIATSVALRVSLMTSTVRVLLVVTLLFGVFTGLVHLSALFAWRPKLLYPAFFFVGLFALWAVLGNKPTDEMTFRNVYARQLRAYTGVKYVWGGETKSGIDCSGLARAAFWQTMFKEGIRDFNSHLMGPNLARFWWRDVSVADMLARKYGYTKIIGTAPKLAGYSNHGLETGDMAITTSPFHVLIYLGNNEWIEANPDEGRVVTHHARPNSTRPHFNMPVTLVRWWLLGEKSEGNEE